MGGSWVPLLSLCYPPKLAFLTSFQTSCSAQEYHPHHGAACATSGYCRQLIRWPGKSCFRHSLSFCGARSQQSKRSVPSCRPAVMFRDSYCSLHVVAHVSFPTKAALAIPGGGPFVAKSTLAAWALFPACPSKFTCLQ